MSERIIDINLNESRSLPESFLWQGRWRRITGIIECWRTVGAWWDGEGERTLFKVSAENGGIFDLCYDHVRRIWLMDRVED